MTSLQSPETKYALEKRRASDGNISFTLSIRAVSISQLEPGFEKRVCPKQGVAPEPFERNSDDLSGHSRAEAAGSSCWILG